MKQVQLLMEEYLYEFYEKVGRQAGRSPETVMADALLRFAGEASLQAMEKKERGR